MKFIVTKCIDLKAFTVWIRLRFIYKSREFIRNGGSYPLSAADNVMVLAKFAGEQI